MIDPSDPKHYDRTYFDGWYRSPEHSIGSGADLRRSVALAVAAAESVLARRLKSVLDIGCGEGRWQPVLRKLRPKASYLGIDSSDYAVERFGARRNLRRGTFEGLDLHVFDRPFDLVVCSDVLQYLTEGQILTGIDALVKLVGGVAFLEVFTAADEIEGDQVGFHRRSPVWYRETFRRAGLIPIGLQMYVPDELAEHLQALDLPG